MLDLPAVHLPIAARLGAQLDQVAVVFERQLASDLSAVNRLCLHVERYRGKMLRPTLVLLCGMAARDDGDAEPGDTHRVVAAVVEMIHMATLVHDDVLDDAEMRRRGATVNHLHGNEAAVMLGDYLISNAFHLCSSLGDPAINLALGEVTNTLCAGELMQLHHRDDYGVSEAAYFEIVRRKTASLIGACCRLGAMLAGADEDVVRALHGYGLALGTAFQVRDDLLDLVGEPDVVGKSLGRDLAKGKVTLPVIRALAEADPAGRGRLLRTLQERDGDGLARALHEAGAVASTQATAESIAAEAASYLPGLPASGATELLSHFAETVATRAR